MLRAEIIGHIGKDAEVKTINNNQYVAFSVAHNESVKTNTDEKQTKVVWISVLMRGNGGNLLQYLKQGQQVFVRGDLMSPRIYTNSAGLPAIGITLFSREIQLCGGSKPDTLLSEQDKQRMYESQAQIATDIINQGSNSDEDLPF